MAPLRPERERLLREALRTREKELGLLHSWVAKTRNHRALYLTLPGLRSRWGEPGTQQLACR